MDMPLSGECQRVLSYAVEEADLMSQKRIVPEHLFLGLLREEECFAAQILRQRGAELSQIRAKLAEPSGEQSPSG